MKHYEDLLLEALHDQDPVSLRALHEARARGDEGQAMQAEVVMLRKQVAALQRALVALASAVAQGNVEESELKKRLLHATHAPGAPGASGAAT